MKRPASPISLHGMRTHASLSQVPSQPHLRHGVSFAGTWEGIRGPQHGPTRLAASTRFRVASSNSACTLRSSAATACTSFVAGSALGGSASAGPCTCWWCCCGCCCCRLLRGPSSALTAACAKAASTLSGSSRGRLVGACGRCCWRKLSCLLAGAAVLAPSAAAAGAAADLLAAGTALLYNFTAGTWPLFLAAFTTMVSCLHYLYRTLS